MVFIALMILGLVSRSGLEMFWFANALVPANTANAAIVLSVFIFHLRRGKRKQKGKLQWLFRFLRLVMTTSGPMDITQLLKAWSEGDKTALDRLAPKVYKELHRMARRYMRRKQAGNTLQTTALVNEVYLRLW